MGCPKSVKNCPSRDKKPKSFSVPKPKSKPKPNSPFKINGINFKRG